MRVPRTSILALILLLAAGCAGDRGADGPPGEATGGSPETTQAGETTRAIETTTGEESALRVMQIASRAPGQGPRRPQAVVAPSLPALAEALPASVSLRGPGAAGRTTPETGDSVYVAVFWGEQRTGGYSISVRSARLQGDRILLRLNLGEPPPDAIVTQALTYPYAIAAVEGAGLAGKEFVLADQRGRELDWPVRKVSG